MPRQVRAALPTHAAGRKLRVMLDVAEQFISWSDYLAIERNSPVRHEWIGGAMFAMAGGSRLHNLISGRFYNHLTNAGVPHGCETFMADMKVVTDTAAYYPDVMVVCDDPGTDEYFMETPCLIIEVSSPSTAEIDRREKWAAYAKIPTLRHYLLVSQTEALIDHRFRTELGWTSEILRLGDTLTVHCPETTLEVAAIYAGLLSESSAV
jgi:Uma2 family endonuclease